MRRDRRGAAGADTTRRPRRFARWVRRGVARWPVVKRRTAGLLVLQLHDHQLGQSPALAAAWTASQPHRYETFVVAYSGEPSAAALSFLKGQGGACRAASRRRRTSGGPLVRRGGGGEAAAAAHHRTAHGT